MSNFTFLKTDWPDLYETASEAEQNVTSAPLSHRFYARRSLERAVKWLYWEAESLMHRQQFPKWKEFIKSAIWPSTAVMPFNGDQCYEC